VIPIYPLVYERVEDHNGRLVRKEMKAKSYPPRNSNKKKAVLIHTLTTQEDTSPVMMQVMMKK
jgi:hypothetical protein